MRVAVQKLPGVESVDVSLERKAADLRLAPGNRVTLDRLRTLVKEAGFAPREATITLVGRLIERGGKPAIDPRGGGTVVLLTADPAHPEALRQAADWLGSDGMPQVEVSGLIRPPANATQPEEMSLQTIVSRREE